MNKPHFFTTDFKSFYKFCQFTKFYYVETFDSIMTQFDYFSRFADFINLFWKGLTKFYRRM